MEINNLDFFNVGIEREKGEVLLKAIVDYDEGRLRKIKYEGKPLEMTISEGDKLFDVLGFQDPVNFAISKKTSDLLISNNISGWGQYNLNIHGVNQDFFGFQVFGKCQALIEPKEAGFYTGFNFDVSSWDGSDFFSPEGSNLLFCTGKVFKLLTENKITNIELENIKDVETYSVGL